MSAKRLFTSLVPLAVLVLLALSSMSALARDVPPAAEAARSYTDVFRARLAPVPNTASGTARSYFDVYRARLAPASNSAASVAARSYFDVYRAHLAASPNTGASAFSPRRLPGQAPGR